MPSSKGSKGLSLLFFIILSLRNFQRISLVSETKLIKSQEYPKFELVANQPLNLLGRFNDISLIYLSCGTILSLNTTSKSILWSLYLKDHQLLSPQDYINDSSISEKVPVISNLDKCEFPLSMILDPITGSLYTYCQAYKCRNLTSLCGATQQLVSLHIEGSKEEHDCLNIHRVSTPLCKEFLHLPQKEYVERPDYYDIKYLYDSLSSEIELFACLKCRNNTYCFNFVWSHDQISDYVSEIHILTPNENFYSKPIASSESFYSVSFVKKDSTEMCLFHVHNNGIKILNRCSLSGIMYFLQNGLLEEYVEKSNPDYKSCSKFLELDNSMTSIGFVEKFHSKSIKATREILDASGRSSSLNIYKVMSGRFYGISNECKKPIIKLSWGVKSNIFDIKSPHNVSLKILDEDAVVIISFASFWREILIAALVITVLGNFFLYCIRRYMKRKANFLFVRTSQQGLSKKDPSSSEESGYIDISEASNSRTGIITSRYKNDFEHIECIGRGGFGVVFKSKNVLDDCLYAVKRIELPDCLDAREKVMREVKALAKLNHHGIIRFYNAWFEDAPDVDPYGYSSKRISKSECSKVSISSDNDYCDISSILNNYSKDSSSNGIIERSQSEDNDDIIIDFYPNDNAKDTKLWDSSNYTETECTSSYASANYEDESYSGESEYSQDSDCVITSCRGNNRCVHSRKVHLYIQMQLCKNKTLRSWLKKTKYGRSHEKSLNIFRQILSAIEFIHSQHLTHRDLKPSNIFFAFDGSVKIGDFGLVTRLSSRLSGSYHKLSSSRIDCDESDKNSADHVLSNNSKTDFAGTSLYMSPEQIKGLPYDCKVDIYSLGLIFFELLVPFKTEMERYKMLTQARSLEFPQVLLLEYPLELDLLKWILDPDSSKRPTATQIRTCYAFQELMVRCNAVPLQLATGCRLA